MKKKNVFNGLESLDKLTVSESQQVRGGAQSVVMPINPNRNPAGLQSIVMPTIVTGPAK